MTQSFKYIQIHLLSKYGEKCRLMTESGLNRMKRIYDIQHVKK